MQIETDRCLIRRFQEKDIAPFMAYRNNAEWMRYQGFKCLTEQEYRRALLGRFSLERGVQLAIAAKEGDRLIGDIYLRREKNMCWFGYSISPLYARQGYASEAAGGVIAWAREMGSSKIAAITLPKNLSSINLLKKLGFIFEGFNEFGESVYTLALTPMWKLGPQIWENPRSPL